MKIAEPFYIVTATTEQQTFNWLFDNAKEARRLVNMGEDHGGDAYWECGQYRIDVSAEEALAEYIGWTSDEEGEDA